MKLKQEMEDVDDVDEADYRDRIWAPKRSNSYKPQRRFGKSSAAVGKGGRNMLQVAPESVEYFKNYVAAVAKQNSAGSSKLGISAIPKSLRGIFLASSSKKPKNRRQKAAGSKKKTPVVDKKKTSDEPIGKKAKISPIEGDEQPCGDDAEYAQPIGIASTQTEKIKGDLEDADETSGITEQMNSPFAIAAGIVVGIVIYFFLRKIFM